MDVLVGLIYSLLVVFKVLGGRAIWSLMIEKCLYVCVLRAFEYVERIVSV